MLVRIETEHLSLAIEVQVEIDTEDKLHRLLQTLVGSISSNQSPSQKQENAPSLAHHPVSREESLKRLYLSLQEGSYQRQFLQELAKTEGMRMSEEVRAILRLKANQLSGVISAFTHKAKTLAVPPEDILRVERLPNGKPRCYGLAQSMREAMQALGVLTPPDEPPTEKVSVA